MASTGFSRSIFVTGGTGFIGQHLVNRLLAAGCTVYVLTRQPQRFESNGRIVYVEGSLADVEQFAPILSDVDAVYHLAVTTVPGRANDQIEYDAQTNLFGSLKLMAHAAKAGVRRFIFSSSGGSVYGLNGGQPIPETHPTDPISAHGVSKLAVEKYLEIYRRKYGMSYRIARMSNPYGEGQDPDRGQGLIAYALGCFARRQTLEIWGDGSVVRDYVYVQDVIDALWIMLDDEGAYSLYNVGSGEGHSINEIIRQIEQMMGEEAAVRHVAARPADVPYNCLHIDRIQQELAWRPQTSLQEGLAATWRWVQSYVNDKDGVPEPVL